ncbi:MAG: TPR end-of-group domain-containing protein [Solirubrobacteraceae bacterium]
MTVVPLGSLERVDVAGVHWLPLRRALGVTAFKTNAYTADAGERLIEEHDESGSGQEEMYVLVSGRAAFEIDGRTVDVSAGSVVFYPDPAARRGAIAQADGTLAVAVGGTPGAAGPVSAWEHRFAGAAQANAGDPDGAYATAAVGLADHPDDPQLHYDLACFAALGGHREHALDHWRRAAELRPAVREWAAGDRDLDLIRDAL